MKMQGGNGFSLDFLLLVDSTTTNMQLFRVIKALKLLVTREKNANFAPQRGIVCTILNPYMRLSSLFDLK